MSFASGAAMAELQVYDADFETRDRLRLFARSWRPGGRSRAIVAIVHGYADHCGRYAPLAQRLAADGFSVAAFDLRGHGRSPGRRAILDRFDDYLSDVEEFLKSIRRRDPHTPLFLFGHSMGGSIAALLAIERPPDVRGVILSAPVVKLPDDLHPFVKPFAGALGAVLPWLPVVKFDETALSRDPAAVAAFHDDPLVYHGRLRARLGAELLRAARRIACQAERLAKPLLVQHGTADALCDVHGSETLFVRARSADKTLILYPGLYHEIYHEIERDRVTRDLRNWLLARSEVRQGSA